MNITLTSRRPYGSIPRIPKDCWVEFDNKYIEKRVKNFMPPQEDIIISKKELTVDDSLPISLPFALKVLNEAINDSKYLKSFEEIDPETDEVLHRYKLETWKRAIGFLVKFAKWAFEEEKIIIPTPQIYDGPEGSIDIYWKSDSYRLLLNFPENVEDVPMYYGDNYDDESPIKNRINDKKLSVTFINILSIIDPAYVAC